MSNQPKMRWIWTAPLAIAALLGAASFWHLYPRSVSAHADFSLELQRAGTDYRVTWDGQSPVVQAAKRGTLLIRDGSYEKELTLDRDQLATAGIVYSPATTDVSFRLELFGGPEPAVASVRLLAGTRPQVAAEMPVPETALPAVSAPTPPEQPAPAADQPAAVAAPAASDTPAPATIAAAPKPDDPPDPAAQ